MCGLAKESDHFLLFPIVFIYLNITDVPSSPHHATLMVTDRQRDWYFVSQRNLGI
jgi:hypothetical protein